MSRRSWNVVWTLFAIAVAVWVGSARGQDAASDWKPPAADALEQQVSLLTGTVDSLAAKVDRQGQRIKFLETLPQPVFDVRWAGVIPNDPKIDNGPALNRMFANCGVKPGSISQTIALGGEPIYFSTPVHLPARTGVSLLCNGGTTYLIEGAYTGKTQYGGPASRLVYLGPPGTAALTYPGVGLNVTGTLVLQRGNVQTNEERVKAPPKDGTVGLLIDGRRQPPTGKINADGLIVMNFDIGVDVPPKDPAEGSHADNNVFARFDVINCNTGFRNLENQAVGWQVGYTQASGNVETVFDFQDGGDFQCQFLKLTSWNAQGTRVLNIGMSRSNSCQYQFAKIKVDNEVGRWRLVRMEKPGMIDLTVRGLIGEKATPAADAIEIPKFGGQKIDVDMFWNGNRWPEGAK